MIGHHPSELTLLGYAAGTLAEPHPRVVAVHVARCAACRAVLRRAEEAGGVLLDSLSPASLAPDALARTLARLNTPAPIDEPEPVAVTLDGLAKGRWRWLGPNIAMMTLVPRGPNDSRLDLIRAAPGTGLLEHSHSDFETTCVLQGAFDDVTGKYHVGDFAEADGGLAHRPTALPGEECICLIATGGRLRARGLLGRLVRPLIGM
ncbi:ChrR family anti-sigma-E factor [Rhodopila sp.]|uniref:ChrR family anti-sigma-E factor n=1 Tax=Rhodopila sp. TaxID=2480087 RepID=UPI003D0E72B2